MPPTLLKVTRGCFGCGTENATGLGLVPQLDDDGRVRARWVPRIEHRGISQVAHGGILTTVCDEIMSFGMVVLNEDKKLFVTTSLEMTFLRPCLIGESLVVEGWATARRGKNIFTRARIVGPEGKDRARSRATYLEIPEHIRGKLGV